MVEREVKKKLKFVRFDNGATLGSLKLTTPIRHKKTICNTPQHNGVPKRMNCIIIKKVKCMLKIVKLPNAFSSEVA